MHIHYSFSLKEGRDFYFLLPVKFCPPGQNILGGKKYLSARTGDPGMNPGSFVGPSDDLRQDTFLSGLY